MSSHPTTTAPIGIFNLKVVLTMVIWLIGLLSVFAPRRLTGAPTYFSFGNMMASGILLSGGLVHQLADSAEVLNEPGGFPWSMFIAGLTFVIFMIMEESIHLFLGEPGIGGHDHQHTIPLHQSLLGDPSTFSDSKADHTHTHSHVHAHIHSHSHSHSHSNQDREDTSPLKLESETKPLLSEHQAPRRVSYSRLSISCSQDGGSLGLTGIDECGDMVEDDPTDPQFVDSIQLRRHSSARISQLGDWLRSPKTHDEDPTVLSEHHHHDTHIDLHLHGSIVASGVLLLALSIHSILAGVSIGIEDSTESITGIAIAILAHKSFEGFALGSSMVNTQMAHLPFMVLGFTFSIATPLGIILGQIIQSFLLNKGGRGTGNGSDDTDRGENTIAVVNAIVAGTFLYISIVEIGSKELLACRHEGDESHGNRKLDAAKLLCLLFGFLAMSLLALYT